MKFMNGIQDDGGKSIVNVRRRKETNMRTLTVYTPALQHKRSGDGNDIGDQETEKIRRHTSGH